MNRRNKWLGGAATAIALVIAGCGGATGYGNSASTAGPAKAAGGARLAVVKDPKLGKIVVDANGRTLFLVGD